MTGWRRAAAAAALLAAAPAGALPFKQHVKPPPVEDSLPPALQGVEIQERLGERVPLDAAFTGADGRPVRLGSFFGRGRPVVLTLVYYRCPMLCGLVLSGLARAIREMGLPLGEAYDAVAVSFDPRESGALAAERQRGYLQAVGRPEAAASWAFLTGQEPEIRALADAVGFRYTYDERTRQYAHAAAIFVLTPEGRVSRYLYGVDFPARDLRLAVVEAGEGRVGTSFDRLLLTCFRYDASSRRYEPYVVGFIRIAALAVLGGLAVTLAVFWRREVKRGTVR
ncbi:MAG TPA: SCO family protein [Anaeromyxobacteraceae bacterium]